jgi:hypothetical protein
VADSSPHAHSRNFFNVVFQEAQEKARPHCG